MRLGQAIRKVAEGRILWEKENETWREATVQDLPEIMPKIAQRRKQAEPLPAANPVSFNGHKRLIWEPPLQDRTLAFQNHRFECLVYARNFCLSQ